MSGKPVVFDPYNEAKRIVRKFSNEGCGDNSCRFKRPTGMATNGGCRCADEIERSLVSAVAAGAAAKDELLYAYESVGWPSRDAEVGLLRTALEELRAHLAAEHWSDRQKEMREIVNRALKVE